MLMREPALPLTHPVTLIATFGGSGLVRGPAGTWGTLAALPIGAVIGFFLGGVGLAMAGAIAFVLGMWASGRYAEAAEQDDPGPVVIDEVAAFWLALVPVAEQLAYYLPCFVLFRFFDIFKIYPANVVQRRLKGAAGIMLDDLVAGLYSAVAVFALSLVWKGWPIFQSATTTAQ